MSYISKFIAFFKIDTSELEVNRERHTALTRQVPIMYAILVINMFTLVYPYIGQVPHLSLFGIPCALTLFFAFRSHQQYRNGNRQISDQQIIKNLNKTTRLAVVLGAAFIAWSHMLFSYNIQTMNIHIAFFLYISLICCSFFLMHVLQSVIALSIVILAPTALYSLLYGDVILNSLTLNIVLVSAGITYLLFFQFQNFKSLIRQRTVLSRSKTSLIEQAKKLEQMNIQNVRLANKDTLTSLPNRRSFFAQLEATTKAYKGHTDKKLVVGLLDLDGFKRINDVFGHPAGDNLLIRTSERLKDVLGDDIILARLGGDEFGLIITNPAQVKDILTIGNQICEAMRAVFHLREGSVKVAATVGFVEFPSMASNAQSLFERADYALCYSKQHSKGEPVIFSKEHETIIREVSNIEVQLAEANLEQELSVMFQPIVDTNIQKTVGFEALARWNNPILGNVRPDIFIRSAEQMGSIGKLTTILLGKALQSACHWPEGYYLSFNLSIYDLSSPQTVLSLISMVEKSDFPSNRIVFEVTETAVMTDFEQANDALNLLKLQGAQIALDDFGTGYSSLSYVQKMPLDRLKIDRSFIIDIATDSHSRNIVQTIIDMCNNLGLYCIVEGVETKEQLDTLKKMGCRYIQGYYFSKPLNQSDAQLFIQKNSALSKNLKLSG
ncbi:MAG: EAL domain-containing protein [Hyphomicrobiales bacterium]